MRYRFTALLMVIGLLSAGCGDTTRRVNREEFMKQAQPSVGDVVSISTTNFDGGYASVAHWEMLIPTNCSRTITYYIPVSELTAADLRELERRNVTAPKGVERIWRSPATKP